MNFPNDLELVFNLKSKKILGERGNPIKNFKNDRGSS